MRLGWLLLLVPTPVADLCRGRWRAPLDDRSVKHRPCTKDNEGPRLVSACFGFVYASGLGLASAERAGSGVDMIVVRVNIEARLAQQLGGGGGGGRMNSRSPESSFFCHLRNPISDKPPSCSRPTSAISAGPAASATAPLVSSPTVRASSADLVFGGGHKIVSESAARSRIGTRHVDHRQAGSNSKRVGQRGHPQLSERAEVITGRRHAGGFTAGHCQPGRVSRTWR